MSDGRKEDRMRGHTIDERTRDATGDDHMEIEEEEIENEEGDLTNLGVSHTKNNDFGDNKKPSQNDERKEDRMRGQIIDERTRDTCGDGHVETEGEEIENEEGDLTNFEVAKTKNNDFGGNKNPHKVLRGRKKGRGGILLMTERRMRLETAIWRLREKLDKLDETGLN